jgi:hypothetical protein
MGFARYTDKAGQKWLVDMDGVQHLVRSYVRSKAVLHRSRLNYEPQDMGVMGALPGLNLTLITVRTNYNGLGNQVDKDAEPLLKSLKAQLASSGKSAFNTLVEFRNETVNNNETFRDMQVDASQQNNAAIDRVMKNSKNAENAARFVRDLSTTVLTVGAAFLSGGAALAAIGGTSVLKGSFTYEDKVLGGASTEDAAGAAGLEMSSDLIVGMVGYGEASAVTKAFATRTASDALGAGVLVLTGAGIDGTSEFVKATVDGKTVQQGLIAAGTRAGVHIVSAAVLGPMFDRVFSTPEVEGLSYPVTVTVSGKLAANTTASMAGDSLVKWLGDPSSSKPSSGGSAAWHQSLACTYTPLGDSDVVYVEQHAMKQAKS